MRSELTTEGYDSLSITWRACMTPCCLFTTRNPALLGSPLASCCKALDCGRQARFRWSSRSILLSTFMDIPPGPVVLGSKLEGHRVEKAAEAQHFPSASDRIILVARGLLAPSACRAVAGGTRGKAACCWHQCWEWLGREAKKPPSSYGAHRLLPMGAARVLEGNIIPPPKLSLRAVPVYDWWYLQCGEK